MALLRLDAATAYEVSKQANLPKANSYTVLENLSNKGAVQPISENPTRYIAISPEVLFRGIADTTQQRCDRLRQGLASLSMMRQHEYVWSIKGMESVRTRIDQMIDAAQDHIWIKASEDNLEPHREALNRAARRKVAIIIILFGTDPEKFRFGRRGRVWLHEGNGIPVGFSPYLITITRDFEEALVAELRDQAYGSYTRSRPIVSLADTLIRHELYFAEIFSVLGNEISARFGPALYELRSKYLPKAQVGALESVLRNANLDSAAN
jgi:hypothetical protein